MPGIARDDLAAAKAKALEVVTYAKKNGTALVRVDAGETVSDYGKRWLKAREGKISSNVDNERHLRIHVYPTIGTLSMKAIRRADVERLVSVLDRKVEAGELTSKSAANIWGTVSKLFDDATNAKVHTGLRCLAADPTTGVRGPDDTSPDKMMQHLRPNEVEAFLSCKDVPLHWRRNVAIGVYLGLRDGEQRGLTWPQVSLDHWIVTVSQVQDRHTGKLRAGTKTGGGRIIPIPEPLRPLLQAMHDEAGGEGRVCMLAVGKHMARGLRTMLLKAGIDRRELHLDTKVNKPIRWHDLRATTLTWMAVRGDSPTQIRDIAGHTQTSMTDRYMRAAAILRGGRFGEVFAPLPACLLESNDESDETGESLARSSEKHGGGAGNRTRVRKRILRLSTCVSGNLYRLGSRLPATSSRS